jgi:hypothetical protein
MQGAKMARDMGKMPARRASFKGIFCGKASK